MTNDHRLMTVQDYARTYPWPSVAGIRNYIATADRNDFPYHRVGRRILVRPSEIDRWATQRESTADSVGSEGGGQSRCEIGGFLSHKPTRTTNREQGGEKC